MSRLSNALLAALVLHGLLLFVRTRGIAGNEPAARSASAPELVEVEESVFEEAPKGSPAAGTAHSAPSTAIAPSTARLRALDHTPSSEASGSQASGSDALADNGATGDAPAAPAAAASTESPARKVDLGLDGHFFLGPPSEQLPRAHRSEFQHQLELSISAEDVKHGLARGNALLGSLNAAVRETGPVRGEALLRVTVGADGAVTEVEFLRGATSDWATALKAFRELAARKRVRVPSGARGVRVTFAVKAKVQLPSGAEAKGPSVATPSLDANGLVPHGGFDVADIGSSLQRLVYARVVSEEVL